jgi:predicted DNA-binding protein with PD1-like motif
MMKLHATRIGPGEDLRAAIARYIHDERITAGVIVSGVGSLASVTLRLAGARPEHQPMLERTAEFEIVSLNGTVGHDQMHIHAAVSDTEGRVWGGHLKDGCLTKTTVELAILEDPNQDFVRRPDPATGFDELVVE